MDQDLQKVSRRIQAIKTEWGNRLCILGHYYQTPAILAHVDVVGDSFKLSKEAAAREGCDAIVSAGSLYGRDGRYLGQRAEPACPPHKTGRSSSGERPPVVRWPIWQPF